MTPRRGHFECLEESTALSAYFYSRYIKPLDVLIRLQRASIRLVLIGTHGLGGWRQSPCASHETTVLVAARNHRQAVRALLEVFPHLRAEDEKCRTTLRHPTDFIIELPKPVQPLLKAALVRNRAIRARRRAYRIPSLEMSVALVYAPMMTLAWSDPEKYLAAGDFLRILGANPIMDMKSLAACGELLYKGGGADILERVRRIRAGEKLNL